MTFPLCWNDRPRSVVASTLPVDETVESTTPRLAVTTVSRVAARRGARAEIRVGADADRDRHDDERSVDYEVLTHEEVWLSVGRGRRGVRQQRRAHLVRGNERARVAIEGRRRARPGLRRDLHAVIAETRRVGLKGLTVLAATRKAAPAATRLNRALQLLRVDTGRQGTRRLTGGKRTGRSARGWSAVPEAGRKRHAVLLQAIGERRALRTAPLAVVVVEPPDADALEEPDPPPHAASTRGVASRIAQYRRIRVFMGSSGQTNLR